MGENNAFKIRLRLANGAEMEAAGSQEFVQRERETFLTSQIQASTQDQPPPSHKRPASPNLAWESIIESKGAHIQLRAKLKGDRNDKDACLVLLACAQKILNSPKPTAAQLAKWLRASGYPVQRVDRTLSEAIERGEILASGSRRARRYELTGPGRLKAFLLAEQLTNQISGT